MFATKYRTHTCGELRAEHVQRPKPGQKLTPVVLAGFVDRKADDRTVWLRDHYGKTVVTVADNALPYVGERFVKLMPEDVIQVSGTVSFLPERADLATGEVCLRVDKIE